MKPADELKMRTKKFAIRIVKLFQALPHRDDARTLGKQLLRSGTSVGANYRAVCRSRSKAEFLARLGIVVEEIDETVFWLELLVESNIVSQQRLGSLQQEAKELLAIFASSQLTAKGLGSNSAIPKSDNP
ncbi:MAG TPA: four helix bundle protein [Terriglobales bacterium]|jgi:four helix bundle protein|nr:four helix bundle protein [Terriglobales bacterium]